MIYKEYTESQPIKIKIKTKSYAMQAERNGRESIALKILSLFFFLVKLKKVTAQLSSIFSKRGTMMDYITSIMK